MEGKVEILEETLHPGAEVGASRGPGVVAEALLLLVGVERTLSEASQYVEPSRRFQSMNWNRSPLDELKIIELFKIKQEEQGG